VIITFLEHKLTPSKKKVDILGISAEKAWSVGVVVIYFRNEVVGC